MRVILDVNVWISALLWDGIPDQVVLLREENKITILISQALFTELETTLNKPKFLSKLQSLNLTVTDVINAVIKNINFCPNIDIEVPQLRDNKDKIVLAAAISAQAEAIITGDLDLLILGEFQQIPILKPQDFLNRYFYFPPESET